MAHYKPEFGEAVREAIGDTPYRRIAARAGGDLSPSYVSDMVQGRIPRRERILALARALELPAERADQLLALADYPPLETDLHPAALFWDEVRRINEETGAGIQVYLHEGSANLTAERVRGYVRAIRNTLKEEGLLPQKGEP